MALGVIIIWIGLQLAFGTENPFYVVASGSMIPELQVYDVLVVQGHVPFEDIKIGDIKRVNISNLAIRLFIPPNGDVDAISVSSTGGYAVILGIQCRLIRWIWKSYRN